MNRAAEEFKAKHDRHGTTAIANCFEPGMVRIKLSQHAGKPATAAVKRGDQVRRGALVGSVPAADLGANVHASIDGTVAAVTDSWVEIAR